MDERETGSEGMSEQDAEAEGLDSRGPVEGEREADDPRQPESSVDEALREALRRGYASPPFPAEEIEGRVRASVARRRTEPSPRHAAAPPWWRGGTVRTLLAVAASLALFVGGMEYGRRTSGPVAGAGGAVGPAGAVQQPVSLPLSIQSAGTRYVAQLARFSGQADALTPEERRTAREVALAALYGAAVELLREAGEDEALRIVVETVAGRREAVGRDVGPTALRF